MGHSAKGNTSANIPDAQTKGYNLIYLDANNPVGDSNENDADFIKDIEQFKKDLPIIHVPQVDLA